MTWAFVIVAALTVGSAISAMIWRNLVHSALSLVLTFAGLAALYLQLNAEFVGFVQVLVYVGAVAILIVFAILLTRGTEPAAPATVTTATPLAVSIALVVFVIMAGAVTSSEHLAGPADRPNEAATAVATTMATGPASPSASDSVAANSSLPSTPSVPVKTLGFRLMEEYVVPLEVMGLLLTAAMIGAVIIALPTKMAGAGRGQEVRR